MRAAAFGQKRSFNQTSKLCTDGLLSASGIRQTVLAEVVDPLDHLVNFAARLLQAATTKRDNSFATIVRVLSFR
jgi:hypothetical protein